MRNAICMEILLDRKWKGIFVTPAAGRKFESEYLLAPKTMYKILRRDGNRLQCKVVKQDATNLVHNSAISLFCGAGTYEY